MNHEWVISGSEAAILFLQVAREFASHK